jgi:hypothetical protein
VTPVPERRSPWVLAITVPIALVIDFVLWEIARFFIFFMGFRTDLIGLSAVLIVVMGVVLAIAIAVPDWWSLRVRTVIGVLSGVILIVVCLSLLTRGHIGPWFGA